MMVRGAILGLLGFGCGNVNAAGTRVPVAFRITMGMKTQGSSGRGEKIGDSLLSPRVANGAPWDRVACPQFFAGSAVFEGACTTSEWA